MSTPNSTKLQSDNEDEFKRLANDVSLVNLSDDSNDVFSDTSDGLRRGQKVIRKINVPKMSPKLERNDNEDNSAIPEGKTNAHFQHEYVVTPSSKDGSQETNAKDSSDGVIISKLIFRDKNDDEFGMNIPKQKQLKKVQLSSCNQQPAQRNGAFLHMEVDKGEITGLKVTSTGSQGDPYAIWLAHCTLDNMNRQVLIFENVGCTEETDKKCILYTQKLDESEDYVLTGKKINEIPSGLDDIDHALAFYKRPKAIGSELLFLESLLGTRNKPLLVGFDGTGQPLPLNKVEKYSSDFQAFFRIIPVG